VIAVVVRRISELPEIERRGREIESSNRLSGGGFNRNKTSFFVCFPLFRKKKKNIGWAARAGAQASRAVESPLLCPKAKRLTETEKQNDFYL
jgi:hypothetical protein